MPAVVNLVGNQQGLNADEAAAFMREAGAFLEAQNYPVGQRFRQFRMQAYPITVDFTLERVDGNKLLIRVH